MIWRPKEATWVWQYHSWLVLFKWSLGRKEKNMGLIHFRSINGILTVEGVNDWISIKQALVNTLGCDSCRSIWMGQEPVGSKRQKLLAPKSSLAILCLSSINPIKPIPICCSLAESKWFSTTRVHRTIYVYSKEAAESDSHDFRDRSDPRR